MEEGRGKGEEERGEVEGRGRKREKQRETKKRPSKKQKKHEELNPPSHTKNTNLSNLILSTFSLSVLLNPQEGDNQPLLYRRD